MADIPITIKQDKYATLLFAGESQRSAYKLAGYSWENMKEETIDSRACELAKNSKVVARLAELQEDFNRQHIPTKEKVMEKWWNIADADPNDIIHIRRLCCRHCFGINFEYQWKDEAEYERACQGVIALADEQSKKKKIPPVLPSDIGGYGFDKLLRPHPKCPWCNGEGIEEVHVEDTRFLPPKAKALFAGVKVTQAGIEIKFHDQMKALDNVAKELGMLKDKKDIAVHHSYDEMSDEELEAAIARLERELEHGKNKSQL